MADAYLNLPKKLFDKIQNIQNGPSNISMRVLGAGTVAALDRLKIEYKKAASEGYATGYTYNRINMRQTTNSTPENPVMFIGVVGETAASRMKWIEGGRVRNLHGKKIAPGDRLQKPHRYMGKVRKFIRSRECKQIMEDRFTKIIDSL